MRRTIVYRCLLGLIALGLGCSAGELSEEQVERIRQSTISQIASIKGGTTNSLRDPSPSLVEEMVSDSVCAEKIQSLVLTSFGPDLSDPRYRRLRQLPQLESVYFYCSSDTDVFLSRIARMASIQAVETELADLSDAGMKYVVEYPNLVKLVLYGGSPSVGNAGLAKLEGHENLETLELINTSVNDDGLSVLSTLPNLKILVLFWEEYRGERLTDACFKHLENLTQLEALELSGGWASEEMVERLRSHLPACKITTKGMH